MLFGGELLLGPRPEGGFGVWARLPYGTMAPQTGSSAVASASPPVTPATHEVVPQSADGELSEGEGDAP
jgi:hypothetical protein